MGVAMTESEPVKKNEFQRPISKKHVRFSRVLLAVAGILCIASVVFWWMCIRMPGKSFQANAASAVQEPKQEKPQTTKPNQTQQSAETQQGTEQPKDDKKKLTTEEELKSYVVHLAETIGERNLGHHKELCEAADYIEAKFKEFGYEPQRQQYKVNGLDCYNIDAEIKGSSKPEEIVIIGGHYDSVIGSPGANDNGSGTAAMMVLANHFQKSKPERTLRFVAWTNEEPPNFQNRGKMGSWVYAEKCRKEDQDVVAVLSLETMGYFTNEKKSQKYPAPLSLMYPSTGNFIGFVSNLNSKALQRKVIKKFREHAKVPSEGASLPEAMPGVGWSDHWSFWQEGYVGLMVTDTAPFRYPHYHLKTDTPDKINYPETVKVIDGLVFVIEDLVKAPERKKLKKSR